MESALGITSRHGLFCHARIMLWNRRAIMLPETLSKMLLLIIAAVLA